MNRTKAKRLLWVITVVFIVLIFLIFFLFPIYWTFTTSIKDRAQIFQDTPAWIPTDITFAYYSDLFGNANVGQYFSNSFIVATITLAGTLFLASTSAFGLSIFKFKGREFIKKSIITIRMIPALLFTIPYFVIFLKIGLTDSLLGIALGHIAVNLPFAIWLFLSYYNEIPGSIYEAAQIDGCNSLAIFTKIAIRLITPGIVTVGILVFINSWNEFSLALTLVFSNSVKTLPIAISSMIQYNTDIPFGTLSAIGMIAMIPAIAVSVFAQKYIIKGITAGSVKG